MTSKWPIKMVEELVSCGALAKPMDGNHGAIHPKTTDFVPQGVPFIMASDLEAGRVNLDSCKFISEAQANSLRKGFSKAGDVLISHKATIDRTAIVQESEYDFIVLTPQVTYYRVLDFAPLNTCKPWAVTPRVVSKAEPFDRPAQPHRLQPHAHQLVGVARGADLRRLSWLWRTVSSDAAGRLA